MARRCPTRAREGSTPARAVGLLAILLATALATAPAPAATSDIVVAMTVTSQTSLTPGTCVTGAAGITDFGIVQPATPFVSADCTIGFGSSNDTSRLLLSQVDGAGSAMFRFGDGELRTSWGGSGTGFVTDEPGGNDFTSEVRLQSDGSIITAGYSAAIASRNFTIGRFDTAGALDTTFGTHAGYTHLDLGSLDDLNALEVLPDDSILVGGAIDNGSGYDYVLLKLTPDGQLDGSFGAGGIVETDVSGDDIIIDVDPRPDGTILASGHSGSDMAVFRFLADGSLDPTFGINGMRTINPGTSDNGTSLVVAPDGTIYVAGSANIGGVMRWTLAHLDANGGVLGSTSTAVGTGNSYAYHPHVTSTGHVLVSGMSGTVSGGNDMTVIRHLPDTTIDTSWASNGVLTRSVAPGTGSESSLISMLLPDDRLWIVGNANDGSNRWAMARMLPNGTWDSSFGTNGSHYWTTFNGSASGMDIAQDGRVVLAGSGNGGITLAMLDSTPIADYADAALPGDTDWASGENTFGACLRTTTGANVVPTWSTTGACGADDTDPWMPIVATAGTSGAEVARTNLVGASGTATLRFGVRPAATQRPGAYFAPIDVTVLAP